MKEAMDETRILSTLEVKICMQILGVEEWNYFPISLEEENLDQRILEAFLRLVEMGFLESCDGGYRKTEQMEQIFAQAVHPDFTMQILKKESMPMVVSGNRKKMVVLETLSVQDGKVRVYHNGQEEMWKYLSEFSGRQKGEALEDLPVAARIEKADVVINLEKGRKNRLLYIWQTDTGEKYLKNGEEKETVLEKEAFWKLLEGEKQ
ncbi:MAG: hypothetical protein V8T85_16340 [Blautia faecicola]